MVSKRGGGGTGRMCPHLNLPLARIQTPYPKLMIMVSFCWKMNFPHDKLEINSVLLMMSLKLTIKVVAFSLGHPVYIYKRQYTDKTLTLRKSMNMRASEHGKIVHFHILKLLFPPIFCWHF